MRQRQPIGCLLSVEGPDHGLRGTVGAPSRRAGGAAGHVSARGSDGLGSRVHTLASCCPFILGAEDYPGNWGGALPRKEGPHVGLGPRPSLVTLPPCGGRAGGALGRGLWLWEWEWVGSVG